MPDGLGIKMPLSPDEVFLQFPYLYTDEEMLAVEEYEIERLAAWEDRVLVDENPTLYEDDDSYNYRSCDCDRCNARWGTERSEYRIGDRKYYKIGKRPIGDVILEMVANKKQKM